MLGINILFINNDLPTLNVKQTMFSFHFLSWQKLKPQSVKQNKKKRKTNNMFKSIYKIITYWSEK